MSCENARRLISPVLDGKAEPADHESVMAHLDFCVDCKDEYRSTQRVRQALRTMDRPAMPVNLTARLRVVASHERQRRLRHVTLRARLLAVWERIELCFDNLWRPMALPFAGGMLSALMIFGSIMQSQAFPYNVLNDDAPPMLATEADGEVVDWDYAQIQQPPRLVPITQDVPGNTTAVLVLIDPQGKIADFEVAQGDATREMKDFVLFSRFTPATVFGQPTWGYKLILFPRIGAARS